MSVVLFSFFFLSSFIELLVFIKSRKSLAGRFSRLKEFDFNPRKNSLLLLFILLFNGKINLSIVEVALGTEFLFNKYDPLFIT